ncbi:hypothetical protein [Varibaculum cambriense]|uniref:hypothetical protein n=1 Tax=Varibaculum cambriense TaxID=184870 RepID=UPI0024204B76|nr:hypothetical protein [Varibaculum cambriense]MBS5944870.1 hypothetical protein [Varibaculum cambriense]
MAKPLAHVDTEAREPFIIIDGRKYPLSGAIKNPGGWKLSANYSDNWNGSLKVREPYRAPEGFTFQLFCLETSGFTQISTANYNRDTGFIEGRVYQGGNPEPNRIAIIGWRLVSLSENPNRLQ